jgi:hypothetical protein
MTTVAPGLQRDQQDRTSEPTLPDSPDMGPEQTGAAQRLLAAAGEHTRAALAFPDELAALRGMVAELLFEQAALRLRLDKAAAAYTRLERRLARLESQP